jgi:hypothetical protein
MNNSNRISDTMSSMGESARATTANIQQGLNNAASNVGSALTSAEQAITNTGQQLSQSIESFGSKVGTNVSNTEFLSTNSIVAKTVFILLLLIVFLILFRVGIYIMQYFISPNPNPYIINGMISGSQGLPPISRNPNAANHVVLPRSNNQPDGLEATWSFWLNISAMNRSDADKNRFMHVFNVGDITFNSTGIANINNAPGVYLIQDMSQNISTSYANSGFVNMRIIMDTESPADTASQTSIDVNDLPYNKWFHVAIRLENTVMDVYINGLLTERLTFHNVPKQNYYDINICKNGGFDGSLSNLQYFSRALNVFDINNILFWGPNLKQAQIAGSATASLPNYNYLSSDWYFNKLGAMKY